MRHWIDNHPRLAWLAAGLLIGAVLLGMAWSHAQERHDLPPFDHDKAKALSQQKRAEYERLLFNEIPDWNSGSPRFRGYDGTNRREAEWLAMANDGYELAYITLQVLKPSTGERYSLKPPLSRLTELAEGGDAGAMCLFEWLLWVGSENKRLDSRYEKSLQYTKRGSELGHPACKRTYGRNLLRGEEGAIQDELRGYQLLMDAAREGYDAAGSIALYLEEKRGFGNTKNIERNYCWRQVHKEFSTYENPGYLLERVKEYAKKHDRRDLIELSQRLGASSYQLDDCIQLGFGE